MKDEILLDNIYEFKEQYIKDINNIDIEKKIKTCGIMKACIDESKKSEFKYEFNIEVPTTKIYNQYNSHQCNIYAFLRVVKDILRNNSDLDIDRLDLSSNYINFFDKLEKANVLYNDLINFNDLSLNIINCKVNQYIGDYGTFHSCREIINKYGLVMTQYMNELPPKFNESLAMELLQNKIKCDAKSLINIQSKDEKMKIKKDLIYSTYQFLSKIYGNPPTDFEFLGNKITPLQFKNQYLKNILDEYVTVTSFTKESFFNSYAFIPNIYFNDNEKIVKLSIDQIKESIVKQLSDGVSVWFSAEESMTLDYDENILDNNLYNFSELLKIENVSKNKGMLLDLIDYDHAMCITGVLVKDKEIKQFKVDNSFGRHGKYKGRLIMTPSFLENCVLTTIINKKYIAKD